MQRRDFMTTLPLGLFAGQVPVIAATDDKKPLAPFYIGPDVEPLTPGPTGLNIRTRVRSAQTNGQFSCVEFAVAPKKNGSGPAPA